MNQLRRESPRIGVDALCWEIVDGEPATSLAVDVSSIGVRIERPYTGGPTVREVQLELEVPGIDEIMWARGEACFDMVVPAKASEGGPLGLIRRTGYRLVRAASRDLRLLKEYVLEADRLRRQREELELATVGGYARA